MKWILFLMLIHFMGVRSQEKGQLSKDSTAMGLICAFVAALVLLLGTSHPAQPLSIDMDLVVFGVLGQEMPAMAQISFVETSRDAGLLVPIHTRFPAGGAGLWGAMLFVCLLLLVPVLRPRFDHPFYRLAHFIPLALVSIVLLGCVYLWQAGVTETEFNAYLSEFDLPVVAGVTFPSTDWELASTRRCRSSFSDDCPALLYSCRVMTD